MKIKRVIRKLATNTAVFSPTLAEMYVETRETVIPAVIENEEEITPEQRFYKVQVVLTQVIPSPRPNCDDGSVVDTSYLTFTQAELDGLILSGFGEHINEPVLNGLFNSFGYETVL